MVSGRLWDLLCGTLPKRDATWSQSQLLGFVGRLQVFEFESRRFCHDSYRCARNLRCMSECRREVNIWTPLAAISDLTIHQVVRYSLGFYKPFEFMEVDRC